MCRQFHKPVMALAPPELCLGRNYERNFRAMPSIPRYWGVWVASARNCPKVRYESYIDFLCRQFHKPVMALAPPELRSGRNYGRNFRAMPPIPRYWGVWVASARNCPNVRCANAIFFVEHHHQPLERIPIGAEPHLGRNYERNFRVMP